MRAHTPLKFALIALLSAAAWTQGNGAAAAADKIKVGLIPIVDVAPIYLGKQKGIFAKHGLDPELELAQGGSELISGVITGQRQFGFSNITSILIATTRGLDLKAIAPGVSSTGTRGNDFGGIMVPEGSPLKSAKELAGKTVAVNTLKNIADTSVRAAIRADGGDTSKVKFVEMPFPAIPAALADKKVDAGWVVEPFMTMAKMKGARMLSWNMVDTAPNLMVAIYFTSEKYAKDNPDMVKRFKAAITESLAYADAHPDEVRAIVPTYTKISKEMVGKLTLPRWPTEMNRKSTAILADLVYNDGLVGKKPDLDKLFN